MTSNPFPAHWKARVLYILIVLLFSMGTSTVLDAQTKPATDNAETLWPLIENQLDQQPSDTSFHFILLLVRGHCGQDYDCLRSTYDDILTKLEGKFRHFAGLMVAREILTLAKQHRDIDTEADALGRMVALYQFLGNQRMQAFYREKLLALYEKSENIPKKIQIEASILEGRVWYLNEAEEVLPEMEKILAEAIDQGLTEMANRLRIRIKYICEEFGFYDELVEQVEALEQIPLSDPLQPSEYHLAFHAASGRADLFLREKKYAQAERLYQKALRIFQSAEKSHHDTWLEIYALHRLARLEWERGDLSMAKGYLDQAYTIAREFNMYERLVLNLKMQVEIAEIEQNFADAFHLTNEIITQEAIIDSLAEGFDMEKYHMQVEREQLEVEKANQALELRLRKSQFHSTLVIFILVALLALGLLIGWYKQRQGKRELATQNTLIQQQAEQLRQLDAAKSRFFANVSHELRTPLTLLLGPIHSLLKEKELTQKQTRLLHTAQRSGTQLQELVTEILDLSKLEMGKMTLDEEPTELHVFFGCYFAQFESLAQRKNIDFSYVLSVTPEMTVLLDRAKCRQILYNLLSNAFKFTPAGGRIEAGLSVKDGVLHLTVTDSGPGIHPDDLPHLFDRYFQTTRPDKPAEGGTGIGLALCKEYAQLFGGSIDVESTLGQGTVFRVAFPVLEVGMRNSEVGIRKSELGIRKSELGIRNWEAGREEPAVGRRGSIPGALRDDSPEPSADRLHALPLFPSVEKGEKSDLGKSAGRPTILVVEDNPELQDYLRLLLSEKYHVVVAGNGREALNCLLGSKDCDQPTAAGCQLILSDLMMPVMDGYQLLDELKGNDSTRHLPVIMLTARADLRDKLKALRIGVDDYLLKPFDEEELLVRIENLLKNQAARRREDLVAAPEEKAQPSVSVEDQQWLEAFEVYVREHLGDDTLTVPVLAETFAMSESTLLRQLKRLTGLTPIQYLKEMRLDEARRLLENRMYRSVAQVASQVGYGDTRSFSRSFKKRFGKLPSEFSGE